MVKCNAGASFLERDEDLLGIAGRSRAILIGSLGNLVEWFDFYAFSAFSLYFANSFFPGNDPVTQMLSAAGVFALGVFMRPIGAWIFGYIGDRHGRRNALMLSVSFMCVGSLSIAVTPTYASIGAAAPVLLLIARLLQGFSLGGEYGSSATYLSEMAPSKHRGFYSSFQYVPIIGGQLIALIVLLILQNLLLSPEQLRGWGWGIPFFIGADLALFVLIMRRDMPESFCTGVGPGQNYPTESNAASRVRLRSTPYRERGLTQRRMCGPVSANFSLVRAC
jgi:MHS family alpha-ketoglutarate permease-like MFS transporter